MRRLIAILMPWLLAIALLAPGAAAARSKEARLQHLRKQIHGVEHDLAVSRSKRRNLRADLRRSEKAIAAQIAALQKLDRRIDAQHHKLAGTEQQLSRLAAAVQQESEALSRQLRAAFEMGRRPALQMLLSQQNPARAGRMMVYYDYLSRARTRQIRHTEAELKQIRQLKQSLSRQSAHLAALKKKRSANLATLKQARAVRERAVKRLDRRVASKHERLVHLKRDADRLRKLIQRLAAQPPAAPSNNAPKVSGRPFDRLRGRLPWPVRGPLLRRFGSTQSRGSMPYKGVWIGAAAGTPVKAMAAGTVVFAGWLQRYGLILIIQHPGGYYTLYGHDQVVFHKVGDTVRAGEVIAQTGDTGGYRRSGLYLEIRKGTRVLDPLRWLARH